MNISISNNFRSQRILSALMILIGIMLLAFMIVVEDEPGAIPLLLILAGSIWQFNIRRKIRKTLSQA
ncbi:hypothetical protein [Gracilimonas tropica]|uniref:hypothetical protein n=1 Tax=Gracilimonas tropica TaxID=454600 RepID=UPI00036DA929|nr:hypothetical protein [Gracilimonas tropica]